MWFNSISNMGSKIPVSQKLPTIYKCLNNCTQFILVQTSLSLVYQLFSSTFLSSKGKAG